MNRSQCAGVICLAGICAGILSALAPAGACMAAEPTTAPAKVSAAKALAGHIETIKTEKDPSLVLRAYTKACALNRMDPELNSVYMRRMLKLGRPRAAYMSARILSAQDVDAGLSWAMIGYMMGRSNKYLDSLTATARALEFNSDDPSILNNVGQLAAWFDNAPAPPKLGNREKRIMDKLKDKFQKSQSYLDAYNRINSIYVNCKSQRADLEGKLTKAETAYNKVRTEELTMRADIKRINSQIIQQNKRLDELERELKRNRNRLYARDEEGRYYYSRRAVLDEHARIQRSIDLAESRRNALRKEGAPTVPKIRVATSQGIKLRKDIGTYRTALKGIKPAILRQLRWDPPAVDGVFTAETTHLPRKIKSTTRPSTKVVTRNPETDAAKRLKIAKLYASNKRLDRAREIILEIVEKYPRTKAAAAAKALLKSLSPEIPER
ncbi:MAG: hypothetical protein QGH60_15140 [Phycisphaerae bacterium]|nr:hypothetical protein [Phycisphaerae bacterium]